MLALFLSGTACLVSLLLSRYDGERVALSDLKPCKHFSQSLDLYLVSICVYFEVIELEPVWLLDGLLVQYHRCFLSCRNAGAGHESGSAGETLHPGCHLHLCPVLHRVVSHGGQVLRQNRHWVSVSFKQANRWLLSSRQLCISLVNLSYRLGCLVTTFVPPSPSGAISLAAMIVYSSGPIVGCGLCLLLPETSGAPLPDSLEDCNRQPKNQPASALWRPW